MNFRIPLQEEITGLLLECLERRLVPGPPGAPGLRRPVRLVGDVGERLVDDRDEILGALRRAVVAPDREVLSGRAARAGRREVDAAPRGGLLDLLLLREEGDERVDGG